MNVNWDNLIERYFAGETSATEEAMLRKFLTSAEGTSAHYDDVRAVVAYLTIAKHRIDASTHSKRLFPFPLPSRAVAAAILVVGLGCALGLHLLTSTPQEEGLCLARVNGKLVTDEKQIAMLMQQSLLEIQEGDDDFNEVEQQLTEMFNIVND